MLCDILSRRNHPIPHDVPKNRRPRVKLVAWIALVFVFPLTARTEPGLAVQADQGVYFKDSLFLRVLLAEDPKSFLDQWSKAAKPGVEIFKTKTSFHRGDTVYPAVIFATSNISLDGFADLSYSVLIRRPDGSIYENLENLTVVKGIPPSGAALSEKKVGLKIEETDPFGEYTVKVTITDNLRQVPVEMLFKFTVIDPTALIQPSVLTPPNSERPADGDPTLPDATSPAPTAPPATGRVRSLKN